ncbi:MAG TPA: DHH family phosphoesterase [Rectinema sp.]|nr:DHH family phosphoesterase [Rectinema sp.]
MVNNQSFPKLGLFLNEAKNRINEVEKICIVMGNEAADLDSMSSALTYAWYKSESIPIEKIAFVPLIPIPRDDFKLRTEAFYLFHEARINEDSLFFIDDIDMHALHTKGALRLIIVDHNKLGKSFSEYSEDIDEIIDHHQDEGQYLNVQHRIIEPVGSTATLVTINILRDLKTKIDQNIALLLAGTILLDTVNLDPKAGRVTEKDEEMVNALLPIARKSKDELFSKLQYEKFNVSNLSTFDILRKDYKEYVAGEIRYGISSAMLSLDAWKKKDPNLSAEFAKYAYDKKLKLLIVMNAYTEPRFMRELILYTPDSELLLKLTTKLTSIDLGLRPLDPPVGSDSSHYAYYAQTNESYSRKKLQPVIQDLLQ